MFSKVRNYRTEDKKAVILLDKLVLTEVQAPGLPNQFDDLNDIENNYLKNGLFVVTEVDGEIVGMGAITYPTPGVARVNRMRVHPSYQRRGIASAILKWLEYCAEENGVTKIILDTLIIQEKAQELYESNGYIKTGEGAPNGFRVVMYEKEINPRKSIRSE